MPAPGGLSAAALADELRWTRRALVSLHAQEALAGTLLSEAPTGRTAAGTALAALAAARARGVPDDRLIAADPVILALTAPSLRERPRLPAPAADRPPAGLGTPSRPTPTGLGAAPHPTPPLHPTPPSPASLPPREALRLRIRWVQELQVRLIRDVARRAGADPGRIGLLRWPELVAALRGEGLPADLPLRAAPSATPPLPDAFRLADGGVVVAERTGARGDGMRGVSGGRAIGTVWDGSGTRPQDAVLVVRTLDPALAPLLPGLAGLVAQTGSPLSHLAVLAREFHLPTVVGAADAVRRFPAGTRLTVDGTAGDVRLGDGP
ncbi:PEP-utilizing enzyme [Streptomyces sp. NPDC052415]|uniref:PEP-utilizing enzyme n=1 Tax=Streptomyces sp. NPDC052415 TaxID=3365690 RepID=UPI0037D3B7E4